MKMCINSYMAVSVFKILRGAFEKNIELFTLGLLARTFWQAENAKWSVLAKYLF